MDTPSATPQGPRGEESSSAPGPRGPSGWSITVVESTGSTNADLLAAARTGAPHGTVRAARHQTAGRGRLDRTWDAPAGANLLVSVLFRELPADLHELTQRIALAALDAAATVAGVRARLKWPNDLLVGDAKLAGILAQAGAVDGEIDHVVVGLGMNVGWAPPGAARLGEGLDPIEVLQVLLAAYDALPGDVHHRYHDELATLGSRVRIDLPGGDDVHLLGRAVDVERDGRLVVLDDCGVTHRIGTGDVVHLRVDDRG